MTTRRINALFEACYANRIKLQYYIKLAVLKDPRQIHKIANTLYRRRMFDIANIYFQRATLLQSRSHRRVVEFIAA